MWVCCVIQQSLMATIVNLAQNFVGSNNLNILMPIGQFGTRLQGGKDSASPRYIFTMLRLDILSYFTSLCQQWLCMSRIIHTSILHNAYIARTVIVVWVSVCSCVNLHNSTANKPWSPNLAQSLTLIPPCIRMVLGPKGRGHWNKKCKRKSLFGIWNKWWLSVSA